MSKTINNAVKRLDAAAVRICLRLTAERLGQMKLRIALLTLASFIAMC
jgi:hypothetical protein